MRVDIHPLGNEAILLFSEWMNINLHKPLSTLINLLAIILFHPNTAIEFHCSEIPGQR